MWRPDNWDNPWGELRIKEFHRDTLMCQMKDGTFLENLIRRGREVTFEEGADAMLEILKKQRGICLPSIPRAEFPFPLMGDEKGWVVFIPEEQNEKRTEARNC